MIAFLLTGFVVAYAGGAAALAGYLVGSAVMGTLYEWRAHRG